jgi:hypothetical protein
VTLVPNLDAIVATDQFICPEAEMLLVHSRRLITYKNGSTGAFSMGAQLGGYDGDSYGARI